MPFSVSSLCEVLNISKETVSNFQIHSEALDYNGCEFNFNKRKYIFRKAKVTPKKNGLFVTFWKRNASNITEPISVSDNFDILLIYCLDSSKKGLFSFTKEVLDSHKILNNPEQNKNGKRGFRIYPNWSTPFSQQAIKTKKWQKNHFSNETSLI